jgi:hypothetical protein
LLLFTAPSPAFAKIELRAFAAAARLPFAHLVKVPAFTVKSGHLPF